MEGEQHNTYDIEFYGPNSMMGGFYLGALLAGAKMAEAVGRPAPRPRLPARSTKRAARPTTSSSGTASTTSRNTPRSWRRSTSTARAASPTSSSASGWPWSPGLGRFLPADRLQSTLESIYKHNFLTDFRDFSNVQRTYALNDEKGLLLCSWPKGGRPPLPFVYSDEVWTGIEYQVASHLIYEGLRRGRPERRQGRPRPLRRLAPQSLGRGRMRPSLRPGDVVLGRPAGPVRLLLFGARK